MMRWRGRLESWAVAFALAAALPATGAPAAQPPARAAAEDALFQMDLEDLLGVTLSIVGLGETRQVQRLDATEAQRYPPGTSPLKLLDRLPGVHFTNADAQGTYGWAKRISIRGFTQNQLGFTLDRVPLGDQSYGNHNGLHVSRALIPENLGVIELSQGGGTLATASTSNLGGTVRITSDDPADAWRIRFDQTVGSDALRRSHARLDTGEHHGMRSYLSVAQQENDKWKGWGPQRHSQLNAKLVGGSDALTYTGFIDVSRRAETDYIDLSLASTRNRGFDWDYYAPDWQRAIDAAVELCGADGRFAYVIECDDAYYLGRGLRDDELGYLTLDWQAADGIRLLTTAYLHRNHGQGHWTTPYAASVDVPLSLRVSEYRIDRWGLLPTLSLRFGPHTLDIGAWIERNQHDFTRNFFELRRDTPPNRATFATDPRQRVFGQRFDVDTLQLFVEQRLRLRDDRLSLDFGFKATQVDYAARRLAGSSFAEGEIRAEDRFLPKLALRYRHSTAIESFLAYGENISVYRAGISGPFATTQAAFDTFKNDLEPERSRTIEGGLRRVGPRFEGSLTGYDVLFRDRLLQIVRDAAIINSPTAFANVGAVRTRGIEAAGLWRFGDRIEWYNALAYNDSEYADDYLSAGQTIPTRGKQVVDSPRVLASTNLSWPIGAFALRLGAKYTGPRYISYVNDSKVSGYTIANAALVHRRERLGWAEALTLQLGVTNLFDREHHSTVGTNSFATSDPDGRRHTLSAGAERQVFLSASVTF
jgi:iron complex outermembrane recepter protein